MQILRGTSAIDGEERMVESERTELETEARQLRLSLECQEARLPQIEAELAQADAFRDTELAAARRAEDERALLGEEARRVARGEKWTSDGGNWRKTGTPGEASDEINSDGAASPSARSQSTVHPSQGAIDFEELEARRLRSEVDEMEAVLSAAARHLPDPAIARGAMSLEEAELLTAELREEIAEDRHELERVEAERQHIAEDRSTLDKEEVPLRDWVDHVERELRASRSESAELQAELVAASDRRAEMQRDDLQSLPLRQAGIDVKQVWGLERHAQECQVRKAALREEISEQRARRDNLFSENPRHERLLLMSEPVQLQTVSQMAHLVQLGPPHAPSQDTSPAWTSRQAEEASARGPVVVPMLHLPVCRPPEMLRVTPQATVFSQQESFVSGDGAAGNYWDDLEEF